MKPYKPTYFHNQSVHSSETFHSPPNSSKISEANRGGLNRITNEIKNNQRVPSQDAANFALSLNGPIFQCPPSTPDPTPTNPYNPYGPISAIINFVP